MKAQVIMIMRRAARVVVLMVAGAVVGVPTPAPAQDIVRLSKDTVYAENFNGPRDSAYADSVHLYNLTADTVTIDSINIVTVTAGMDSYYVTFGVLGAVSPPTYGSYGLLSSSPGSGPGWTFQPAIRLGPNAGCQLGMGMLEVYFCPLMKRQSEQTAMGPGVGDTLCVLMVLHSGEDRDTLCVFGTRMYPCTRIVAHGLAPSLGWKPRFAGHTVSFSLAGRAYGAGSGVAPGLRCQVASGAPGRVFVAVTPCRGGGAEW
jgi:hypothetical protein